MTSGTCGPRPTIWPTGLKSRIKSLFGVTPQLASSVGKSIVIADFFAPDFQRRIEEKQGATAVFDILFQGIDFGLKIIAARAAYDDHGAVAWDFGFLQEIDRLCLVIIFGDQFLESRKAGAARIVDLMLAASGNKADRPCGVL